MGFEPVKSAVAQANQGHEPYGYVPADFLSGGYAHSVIGDEAVEASGSTRWPPAT